ncbi:hypothetical protein EJ08DRAFT_334615 [Tothia fuscella]|uniref:Ankyrin repeat protein n=1 Tax=Tothia fuscella TaxID=1048955 RepID=A0A9P4NZH5_9PEZI|nr:hypothetical protein EJ08DRAFT_334615 [Tothia fuscella]
MDTTNTFGKTPLQYTVERGNAAVAKELLEVGARDWALERGLQSVIDILDRGEHQLKRHLRNRFRFTLTMLLLIYFGLSLSISLLVALNSIDYT